MGQLRIAPTISGAVALGAYEGGALAALLVAVQELQSVEPEAIRIDAIGGASAGCMTAMLVAKTLVAGLDPVDVMYRTWVDAASLDNLKTSSGNGPLTMDNLMASLKAVIGTPGNAKRAQQAPVTVRGIICSLRGFDYEIKGVSQDTEQERHIDAVTFIDWSTFTFKADGPPTDWLSTGGPVEIALASGSNAMGFPPRPLDRSGEPWARYEAELVQNLGDLPEGTKTLWFTDGGTLDNEPLGHTLDITNQLDSDEPLPEGGVRLHLLIHPSPAPPLGGGAWAKTTTSADPSWDQTLFRAAALIRTQSLYDDLNKVAKTNSRIRWTSELRTTLSALVDRLDEGAKAEWQTELSTFIAKVRADKGALGRSSAKVDVAATLEDAIDLALGEATGFRSKQAVEVDVVSPLILGRPEPVEDLLAGDFLFAFGGFLDIRLRKSDFGLGYDSMRKWLGDNLGRLTGSNVDAVLSAVDSAKRADCQFDPEAGSKPWDRVTAWEKLEAIGVASHVAQVAVSGAFRSGKPGGP
jgi:Patatin-like phospholipase